MSITQAECFERVAKEIWLLHAGSGRVDLYLQWDALFCVVRHSVQSQSKFSKRPENQASITRK